MSCELSPSAAAFSTMLSAFVGSVITGLTSGAAIAFITGWISWFSVLRILAAGLYEVYLAISAGTNYTTAPQYHSVALSGIPPNSGPPPDANHPPPYDLEQRSTLLDPAQHPAPKAARFNLIGPLDRGIDGWGWLGWLWSAIYTPISQSIWVGVHLTGPSTGIQKFVRALAIGVSALSLTFDTKQRYAAALGRRWGAWAFVAFNAWNAAACVLLGVEALVLLVFSAVRMENVPLPLVIVYPIFSVIWAVGSWKILPPVDGGRGGNKIAGVLMGAFAGLFVAAPAFALWRDAKWDEFTGDSGSGVELQEYLACEGVSVLEKFAAVMP